MKSLILITLVLVLVYTVMMISSMMIVWCKSSDPKLLMKNYYAYSYRQPKSNRPCRVIIEDKVDYHFEIIESVVLRYPLPLHEMNGCDYINEPINFEFSLYQNRLDSSSKKSLNETSFWGWFQYYDKHLKGKIMSRFDDRYSSEAYFGEMISYSDYDKSVIDAIITPTCDWSPNFYHALNTKHQFCVLHGTIERPSRVYGHNDGREKRLCWLNPMFADQCYFLPIDLPSRDILDNDKSLDYINVPNHGPNNDEIRVCVIGNKELDVLFNALRDLGNDYLTRNGVKIQILSRLLKKSPPSERIKQEFSGIITFILDEPFLPFQKRISQCSMLLPMIDPSNQPQYFPVGLKKLSGSISQIIAYSVPFCMHEKLFEIYKDSLAGITSSLYDNNVQSFTDAFSTLIREIKGVKK